jgi:hypothetical protein
MLETSNHPCAPTLGLGRRVGAPVPRSRFWVAALFCCLVPTPRLAAERVNWLSTLNSVNLQSSGASMGSQFVFELGVFSSGFVPSKSNLGQWAAHWNAAQRVTFNPTDGRFSGLITITANPAPFSVGADAYVWGFSGGESAGEWILFRRSTWRWPQPNPLNPFPITWSAKDADQVVLGTIQSSGSPFLMQSAAVAAPPPVTTWTQWQSQFLPTASSGASAAGADPDADGMPNAMEFVFGLDPSRAGKRVAPLLEKVTVGGQDFLQLRIPRLRHRPALLDVEVSTDLVRWESGPATSIVTENSASALVVRDLTPLTAPARRFMRLKVTP